jgi:hypothetical protein
MPYFSIISFRSVRHSIPDHDGAGGHASAPPRARDWPEAEARIPRGLEHHPPLLWRDRARLDGGGLHRGLLLQHDHRLVLLLPFHVIQGKRNI